LYVERRLVSGYNPLAEDSETDFRLWMQLLRNEPRYSHILN
jgi:hypothetical protein